MPKKTRPTKPTGTSKMIVNAMQQGQRPALRMAEMMIGGLASNAATAVAFSTMFEPLDLVECVAALVTATEIVKGGDLAGLEATLTAQAVALNAMFTQLAHRTSTMTSDEQIDRYTRLALKAQGQCRATIETLALMRNPPMVFAKQANIAHGPQQVNNGTSLVRPARRRSRHRELRLRSYLVILDRRGSPGSRLASVTEGSGPENGESMLRPDDRSGSNPGYRQRDGP